MQPTTGCTEPLSKQDDRSLRKIIFRCGVGFCDLVYLVPVFAVTPELSLTNSSEIE